jgi:hypothetical protein
MKNGPGILKNADYTYYGHFKNDKKSGIGCIERKGERYEGDFNEDLMDGIGTYTNQLNHIYYGEWKNN